MVEAFAAPLTVTDGVAPVVQPPATLSALQDAVAAHDTFEMAALGIPQIMTDFSAGKELFSGKAWMLPVSQKLCLPKVGTDGGLVHEDSVAEALLDAYTNPKKGATKKAATIRVGPVTAPAAPIR